MCRLNIVCATSVAAVVLMGACGWESTEKSEVAVWQESRFQWDADSDNAFSNWISNLGEGVFARKCSTVESCLRNSQTNSLWDNRDNALRVFADCADVPFVLRAYFSYKFGLPYSLATVHGERYSPGNHTQCFAGGDGTICDSSRGGELNQRSYGSINSLLSSIVNRVMSGYLRTAAADASSDTFPVAISRANVRPGSVFYDPNGHALTVFRVEESGLVRMFDGHPDNSLSTKIFGEQFARGSSAQGGGFRNWRPLKLQEGKIFRPSNRYLAENGYGYSASNQYQNFSAYPGGSYYRFVRQSLSLQGPISPVQEFDERVVQFCKDLQERVGSVSLAVAAGLDRGSHPGSLPANIYGATGDWEIHSTPSRDTRLRVGLRELYRMAKAADDVEQLSELWNRRKLESICLVKYKGSQGNQITITINDVSARIYDLSFDPYHCSELRWGAKPGVGEYNEQACNVGIKLEMYKKERTLRNVLDRVPGANTPIGSGPSQPEEIDTRIPLGIQ